MKLKKLQKNIKAEVKIGKNDQKRRLINFLFCLAARCGLAALPPLNLPALRWAH